MHVSACECVCVCMCVCVCVHAGVRVCACHVVCVLRVEREGLASHCMGLARLLTLIHCSRHDRCTEDLP